MLGEICKRIKMTFKCADLEGVDPHPPFKKVSLLSSHNKVTEIGLGLPAPSTSSGKQNNPLIWRGWGSESALRLDF